MAMKKCGSCKFMKDDSLFGKGVYKCADCRKADQKTDRDLMRAAVLRTLGNTCACCGEAEQVFLDIDHLHDDGAKDRRETTYSTWRMAFKTPERFQVLCRNCNWGKFMGGCPHKNRPR